MTGLVWRVADMRICCCANALGLGLSYCFAFFFLLVIDIHGMEFSASLFVLEANKYYGQRGRRGGVLEES